MFDHDKCYFFQGLDERIIFAIPDETDFTLIGTTDADHADPSTRPECTPQEPQYLMDFANQYFREDISRDDIVWTYSGVWPLYDDGASSASAAPRNYVLSFEDTEGAPILNVFGGKITTYRKLAEDVMDIVSGYFPVDGVGGLITHLTSYHPFQDATWAGRLVRAYGTQACNVLDGAQPLAALGQDFGALL
ncbi:MAG: glycerol-3-phosphate dehydrogenase [Paracoccaceae bacterium]